MKDNSTQDRSFEGLETSAFLPRKGVPFVDVLGLHNLYDGLAYRANVILVGPKGIGKTMSFQSFAEKKQHHIITFDCSEDVRRSHLVGTHILRGNETPFVLGPLTQAFEVANEVGHCILALEEVNALSPQMQKVLNGVADFRRRIEVPEIPRVFELKDGAKLWLVGTMNTAVYGGVYALNEDLKSRFRMIALDYPDAKQELAMLEGGMESGALGSLPPKTVNNLIRLAVETRQNATEYALSTRDVQQTLEDVGHVGLPRALRVMLGKFDGADRAAMKKRIQSIFGVKVDEREAY
jgi:nitric oxide reductase NorQ protein